MFKFDEKKIKEAIRPIIKSAYSLKVTDKDLRKNTLDVFSASMDSLMRGITHEKWLAEEKTRQVQKKLQNKIGELHQAVLGTIDGVENLGVGAIIDLESEKHKIIAEIKNKHNTTKGNHKVAIYDDLDKCLKGKELEYNSYYVEILPKNGKSYDEPFTPSDNKTKTNRAKNERIRVIDGKSFYKKITGDENALKNLYEMLPTVASEILKEEYNIDRNPEDYINIDEFDIIYGKKD